MQSSLFNFICERYNSHTNIIDLMEILDTQKMKGLWKSASDLADGIS